MLSAIPVVITGLTGSFMVVAVNAWMNHPGGFELTAGHVTGVQPWRALFANPYFWHEIVHMYLAGYIVCGFVLAAVYAFGRLRGRWGRYERAAFAIPLTVAALAAPVQVLVGDWAGREVARMQPTKLAALEGLRADRDRAARAHRRLVPGRARAASASRSRGRCRSSPSTTRTPPCAASTRSRRATGRR